MHETLKEVSADMKALGRSIAQSEQQHIQHQRMSEENRAELQLQHIRVSQIERSQDRLSGSISALRWFGGIFSVIGFSAVSWLLSVVLSNQSATQIQHSKQSTVEARLQILEQRKDGP
jgi:hypothetical protein